MKQVNRKIYKIDATDQTHGRLAGRIAYILTGKRKVGYRPNVDSGDIVEISNANKMKFSGKKLEQKPIYHHTGYTGHLKKELLGTLYNKKPAEVLRKAVMGMLPKNKLRPVMIKRLKFVK